MKRGIGILAALLMLLLCAGPVSADELVIGGADGPTAIFIRDGASAEEDIHILDGPGSYMEQVSGIVQEIREVRQYGYTLLIRPDEEYADRYDSEFLEIDADLLDTDGLFFVPPVGFRVWVRYPGGYDYGGDPVRIVTNTAVRLLPFGR